MLASRSVLRAEALRGRWQSEEGKEEDGERKTAASHAFTIFSPLPDVRVAFRVSMIKGACSTAKSHRSHHWCVGDPEIAGPQRVLRQWQPALTA